MIVNSILMRPTENRDEGGFHHAEKGSVFMGKVLCKIDEDNYIGNDINCSCNHDSRITKLENDVAVFKKTLQQEQDLNSVLESALSKHTSHPDCPRRIPLQVQELLSEVAILELAVLTLEEQILSLHIQIKNELVQRHILEQRFNKSFVTKDEGYPELLPLSAFWSPHLKESPSTKWSSIEIASQLNMEHEDLQYCLSSKENESTSKSEAHLLPKSSQPETAINQSFTIPKHSLHHREQLDFSEPSAQQLKTFIANSTEPNGLSCDILELHPTPGSPEMLPTREARSSPQGYCDEPLDLSSSPRQWTFWQFPVNDQRTGLPPGPRIEANPSSPQHGPLPSAQRQGWVDIRRLSEQYWKKFSTKHPSLFDSGSSATAFKAQSSYYSSPRISVNKQASTANSIRHPCVISEDMVQCMIDIYCYLSDTSGDSAKSSQLVNLSSPTSPLGHAASSSFSSLSESSLLSFVRCPTVNLQNKDRILGSETTFDPYKTYEKVSWAEIGVYSAVVEVLWISVGKEQLEFAATALCKYKVFVEELSKANIKTLTNAEKLAFWINTYNALVMHAFLAYGIPKSEAKLFSMLQKATYVVGGHSFSAIAIEFGLLKGKAPAHRPQMALLLAFHRLKLSEEQIIDAIEHQEPLTMFALCSGSYSSPAVRVYTAEKVLEQLQESFHDYIRASVGINLRGKLLVPKLLYQYAHGIVEDAALVDWICQRMPGSQSSLIQDCMQQRQTQLLRPRKFKVVSFDLRFRYLFLAMARRKSSTDAYLSHPSADKNP
ncbi:hypothetical protein O6H91_17G001100 [Diphasiastrum complanatum]|uniref:Uncharacterized protein n=2 Tax=Diphasiastrum complanatum TaxID=34168 RepID=A0ACC2B4I3_DIPCM|nr:hypothetical protein O6H91_17G001100 [Diphasiastrum complanatum]KAJ7524342.1 hypothetical protein O6H91_17G001100 [Diphasiastrum complanatum]